MKLTRGAYALYVDASMGGETPSWYLIGKDIEELNVSLGADVESKRNILDETTSQHNGYEPSIEAEPYYANTTDPIYAPLKEIAMNRDNGDACKTKYLEVIIEDTEAESHPAWIEDCLLVPQSYGGDTSGFQIPFNIHPDGNRKQGTVVMAANKVPTFTPAT